MKDYSFTERHDNIGKVKATATAVFFQPVSNALISAICTEVLGEAV